MSPETSSLTLTTEEWLKYLPVLTQLGIKIVTNHLEGGLTIDESIAKAKDEWGLASQEAEDLRNK